MNNELEIRKIVEKVLKDEQLHNFIEIFKKEHNPFRGTHKIVIGTQGDQGEGEQGPNKFIDLVDTPATYSGQQGKVVAVKDAQNGLEFIAGGPGIPIGAIIPYLGGYFTNGSNGGFTMVMAAANSVAAVNALLNPDGLYVCDGAALNHASSPIWNAAGRYLPNLTDDRFIMGDTVGGVVGGNNAMAHTHTGGSHTHAGCSHYHSGGNHRHILANHRHSTNLPSKTSGIPIGGTNMLCSEWSDVEVAAPNHTHSHNHAACNSSYYQGYSGYVSANTGSKTPGQGGSGGAVATSGATNEENRPKFLSCFYIVRVF